MSDALQHLGSGVPGFRGLVVEGVGRLLRPPGHPPPVVDRAMPRDPEQPSAERGRVTIEAMKVARGLQPGLGGDVLGRFADDHPQISQYGGLQHAPQDGEAGLVPGDRSGQRPDEFVVT